MSKLAQTLAGALTGPAVAYLLFAFGSVSFDIGTWDSRARWLCAFLMAVAAFRRTVAAGAVDIIRSEERPR